MTMTRVYIHEVAPRDGLQAEKAFVETPKKIAFIDALGECCFAKIEATSFTSPRAIPALADAAEVMAGIARAPGTVYAVLVPNVRGAERALEAGADELNVVMSVSAAHNRSNLNMEPERSFEQIVEIAALLEGTGTALNVSLSTAFGCPYDGRVDPDEVLAWAERYRERGVTSFTICDTIGCANPAQVESLASRFVERFADCTIALHFHDTRGMALANVMAGLGAGVRRFEASVGGLGGCPYAPGATGNACTEDMVHMLEEAGCDTGIDLHRLLEISRGIESLVGHEGNGRLARTEIA